MVERRLDMEDLVHQHFQAGDLDFQGDDEDWDQLNAEIDRIVQVYCFSPAIFL